METTLEQVNAQLRNTLVRGTVAYVPKNLSPALSLAVARAALKTNNVVYKGLNEFDMPVYRVS